jgi:hypothetical protein
MGFWREGAQRRYAPCGESHDVISGVGRPYGLGGREGGAACVEGGAQRAIKGRVSGAGCGGETSRHGTALNRCRRQWRMVIDKTDHHQTE